MQSKRVYHTTEDAFTAVFPNHFRLAAPYGKNIIYGTQW